jgi:environmental stress-induced protein Ves
MALQHVRRRLHPFQENPLDLRAAPAHHDEGKQVEPDRFRRDAGVEARNHAGSNQPFDAVVDGGNGDADLRGIVERAPNIAARGF